MAEHIERACGQEREDYIAGYRTGDEANYYPALDPRIVRECREDREERERLRQEAEAVKAENGRLRSRLDQAEEERDRLRRILNAEPEALQGPENFEFRHVILRAMAAAVAAEFHDNPEALNYLEYVLEAREGESYIFTLIRQDGKRPHELRKEAEAEAATLRQALRTAREALDVAAVDLEELGFPYLASKRARATLSEIDRIGEAADAITQKEK